jgi:predicted DNA-binding transcriptional regulator AlpA
MEEKLLATEDVMRMFHICRDTLHQWIKNREDFPKPFKAGRRNLWKESAIKEFLEKKAAENTR